MNENYKMTNHDYRRSSEVADSVAADASRTFLNRVYNWMAGGLAITGLIAWYTSSQPSMMKAIFGNQILFFGLIILELVLVVVLSAAINKMSAMTAGMCYAGYAALNGLVMASIFWVYNPGVIYAAFFTCAGTFAVTSIYGYMTKTDLSSVGSIAIMALWGLIIASIVNIFWANSTLYWIITYAGVLIFVALTAYDTQKLRQIAAGMDEEGVYSEEAKKYSILGALTLYLDFINLFLMLLRIFGGRRD